MQMQHKNINKYQYRKSITMIYKDIKKIKKQK